MQLTDKEKLVVDMRNYYHSGELTPLKAIRMVEDAEVIKRTPIMEVRQVPMWISVEERLPEESGDVFAVTKFGYVSKLPFSKRHGKFNVHDYDSNISAKKYGIPCTHWMPLPELPKDVVK